ncbi:MAG TPA: HD-GYP domain-containing protein, partial [Gemmatimonadales bacterium]|nr:HD-GYP domain-containing protein [Gemmatimonadales bacterium]
ALVAGCLFLALAVSVAIYHFDRLGLGPFNWPAVLYMVPLTIMLLAGGLPGVTVMNAVVATAYVATLALEARYAVVAPLRTPAHLVQIYGNLLFFLIFASFAGSLRTRNMWLVERLRQRWERLRETFDTTVTALSAAVETTDPSTLRHLDRVRTYAVKIAERLELPPRQVDLVRYGAVLHDVGKIAVPHNLLTKPGPLTPDEMAAVQRHVELGAVILERIGAFGEVIPLVRYHEERWDGRTEGPYAGVYGLKGEDIPLGARIIAVADAYDAMVSDRPYRKAPGPLYAARELAREAGAQFDPQVVAVFLQLLEEERVASAPAQAA